MHIKTLRIQGFKSYRDQTAVEEFSPGHNVVVGRNGSGKSNFFAAIRFVLSDAYTSMSREERQALLHDSSASVSATLSAFVEIVFDNSDGRFPHGSSNELTLRRTIGVKKDEYSLDRKSVTKQEVMDMLEAAGFSRSNPYYIVPQGRITHLTNMKDEGRLNLLKEVAGTKVYETRRADSLRIMEETDVKKKDIEKLLVYIGDRLKELDKERKELKEYHEKDKERRCLEYALFYKELQDVIGSMEDLDEKKKGDAERMDTLMKTFNEKDAELLSLEEKLATLTAQLQTQIEERDALVQERRELARTQASLESAINDGEERAERSGETRPELEARAAELDARISEMEGELMGHIPTLDDKSIELAQARAALDDTNARIGVLFAKQARSNQFQNQEERDAALREELQSIQNYESLQERSRAEVQQEIQEVEARITELGEILNQKATQMEERKKFIQERGHKWEELRKEEDKLMENKKVLWKEEEKLRSSAAIAKQKYDVAAKDLAGMIDRGTARGLEAVEEIVQRLGLSGVVYGPLYKLFTVEDRYKTAVEVTAGQSLFHVVVDTDETASQLLEVMNREKSGRVTFVPLNRIKPKVIAFQEKNDAMLLINKVTFDDKFKSAMEQVFARTVLCSSLEVASSYVKSHGVNGITLEGDRVERRGALTGGYHDPRKSRLDAVKAVALWQEVYATEAKRQEEIKQEITELEQRITALTSERQQLESRSQRIAHSRTMIQEEMHALREEEAQCQQKLQRLKLNQEQLSRDLSTSSLNRSALEEELKTPMRRGLQSDEEAELKSLTLKADQQEKEVAEIVGKVNELTNKKQTMEMELDTSLKRDRELIANQLEIMDEGVTFSQEMALGASNQGQSIAARKKKLNQIKKQLVDRQKALDRLELQVDSGEAETAKVKDDVEQMTRLQADEARKLEKHDKVVAKIMAKTREYNNRKEEAERKIRELGVVPGEAYNKCTSQTAEKIFKQLHKINAALKKFSNVNKRAVEQYDGFTKQRDQLLSRQEDLNESSESIVELIETLDMRKDEAIDRTFKQVSMYFAEIFEKLVPMGRGSLFIKRKADEDQDEEDAMQVDDDDDDEDESVKKTTPNIENYTGVSIKVSFNSKVDEGLKIQQLSGGQKSLVALAIVFAIQKCDPAPFYLFDEIDANLDAQYRTAVAGMIQELSSTAQFITTTFRPELVGVGEKHYGVLFNAQKVSSLQVIAQDDAYQFVEASAQTA